MADKAISIEAVTKTAEELGRTKLLLYNAEARLDAAQRQIAKLEHELAEITKGHPGTPAEGEQQQAVVSELRARRNGKTAP